MERNPVIDMKMTDFYKGIHQACAENRVEYRLESLSGDINSVMVMPVMGLYVRDKWESGGKHLTSASAVTTNFLNEGAFDDGEKLINAVVDLINEKKREVRFARLADR